MVVTPSLSWGARCSLSVISTSQWQLLMVHHHLGLKLDSLYSSNTYLFCVCYCACPPVYPYRVLICEGSRWKRWHVQTVASHLEAWTCPLVLLCCSTQGPDSDTPVVHWGVHAAWLHVRAGKSCLTGIGLQAPTVASYTFPCVLSAGQSSDFNLFGWEW